LGAYAQNKLEVPDSFDAMARPLRPLNVPSGKNLTPELAFAQILREKRTALGLTQADLEDDQSFDRSYISKLELGKVQVCIRGIIHLARKIEMTPGELMDEVMRRVGDG
jgi:hypothetical protein